MKFKIENKNIKNLFNNALKNGGLTVAKTGRAVEFETGYQVSKKDCFVIDVKNKAKCLKAISQVLSEIESHEFCGLWIDKNKLYIDVSVNVTDKKQAVEMGLSLNQLSIFDWANKSCINLK